MSVGRGLLIIASVGALALLVRSVLKGPVPLSIALAAFAVYLVVVALGVLFPCLEMFAEVLCKGSRRLSEVAITFDGGPHPLHTARVLDALDRASAKATFFVLAAKASEHPDVVREIAAQGHEIGILGCVYGQRWISQSPKQIADDMERAIGTLQSITGRRPGLFRPQVPWLIPRVSGAASKLGLTIVTWSVRGQDDGGSSRDLAADVAARVRRRLKPGAIVQLHDASAIGDAQPAGVVALPAILDAAYSEGLTCVDVVAFARDRGGDRPNTR